MPATARRVTLSMKHHNLAVTHPFPVKLNKNALSSSNLHHKIRPDLLLVIEARRYERTSISLPVAQPSIFLARGQSMTSTVTDVVLSPTVPSVYSPTVEN